MKPRLANQRNQALTLIDVLVIIAVLAVVWALLVPAFYATERKPQKINCISNLKQIAIAYRLWEGDNNNLYPMAVSMTNGGAMELVVTGNVVACFRVMSNELSTPKILFCPQETHRVWATDFSTLKNSNIGYFVGVDADESKPQTLLSGDDNLAVGTVPVRSGLVELISNSPVSWASARHVAPNSYIWTPARYRFVGNIGFADGSVRQVTTDEFRQVLEQTGAATNRLAIP